LQQAGAAKDPFHFAQGKLREESPHGARQMPRPFVALRVTNGGGRGETWWLRLLRRFD